MSFTLLSGIRHRKLLGLALWAIADVFACIRTTTDACGHGCAQEDELDITRGIRPTQGGTGGHHRGGSGGRHARMRETKETAQRAWENALPQTLSACAHSPEDNSD